MDLWERNDNFTVSPDLYRPALVIFIGLEIIVALCANSFVLLYTFCHHKVLKHPANIFLTNFVLGNLLMTVLYMPSMMVSAAAGEWVFGTTLDEKVASCQFFGYICSISFYQTTATLTLISIDRFSFIVKPNLHKILMKTRYAVIYSILSWITSAVMSLTPFLSDFGEIEFGMHTLTCLGVWSGQTRYLVFGMVLIITYIVIIAVTSIWTFCFTRSFIKKIRKQQSSSNSLMKHQDDIQRHVYKNRMCNIVGIFSAMLVVMVASFALGLIAALVGSITGIDSVPGEIYTASLLMVLLNNVLNPIVQSYFRRELKDFIVKWYKLITNRISCNTRKSRSSSQNA